MTNLNNNHSDQEHIIMAFISKILEEAMESFNFCENFRNNLTKVIKEAINKIISLPKLTEPEKSLAIGVLKKIFMDKQNTIIKTMKNIAENEKLWSEVERKKYQFNGLSFIDEADIRIKLPTIGITTRKELLEAIKNEEKFKQDIGEEYYKKILRYLKKEKKLQNKTQKDKKQDEISQKITEEKSDLSVLKNQKLENFLHQKFGTKIKLIDFKDMSGKEMKALGIAPIWRGTIKRALEHS